MIFLVTFFFFQNITFIQQEGFKVIKSVSKE